MNLLLHCQPKIWVVVYFVYFEKWKLGVFCSLATFAHSHISNQKLVALVGVSRSTSDRVLLLMGVGWRGFHTSFVFFPKKVFDFLRYRCFRWPIAHTGKGEFALNIFSIVKFAWVSRIKFMSAILWCWLCSSLFILKNGLGTCVRRCIPMNFCRPYCWLNLWRSLPWINDLCKADLIYYSSFFI